MIAPTAVEVVRSAGGWLFDRVMAGWDVVVHVGDHVECRPLRILGAQAVDLEGTLAARARRPQPQTLAVAAGLCGSDARVGRMVRAAVAAGETEVRLWDDDWSVDGDSGSVCHQLSVAARAFKAQALAAASVPVGTLDVTELFRRPETVAGWQVPAQRRGGQPEARQPVEAF